MQLSFIQLHDLYVILALSTTEIWQHVSMQASFAKYYDHSTVGMRCFQQLSPNLRAPLMRNTK